MPVSTVSAAVHITPVVVKTFFSHGKRKAKRIKNSEEEKDPQDDIFFDEAFNITKSFIDLGTRNTVESLQAFTNTHVPAPYWVAVVPLLISMTSCNQAADLLIDWFDPEELQLVVGGERWWQVRGLDGIEGEWITEKEFLTERRPDSDELSDADKVLRQMDDLDSVMLYIHGGGYFWGSINTHRYQFIRYARKIKGRVFAVNYRKAPQYPWPCPLHDILAAYLYLIQPPPEARHKAVDPKNIVLAGDSAGGGLAITLLTIIRDMGLPAPAGAVLISPWIDLTHSFPSVMNNVASDIIPPHGFLAKPSTLWPLDPLPPEGGRVTLTKSNPPPEPGHADTLEPEPGRVQQDMEGGQDNGPPKSQEDMLEEGNPSPPIASAAVSAEDYEQWEPKPPKVLMDDPKEVPLELRSQIQMYATNEQLTHPLVSPILQGSLANLPPLFILAGDGELLRDEVIYLAHRAAYPKKFPPRRGRLSGQRQKDNAEKYTTPTEVHLQLFDGMCHVLTVFSFAKAPTSAYRSIAQFVKNVTTKERQNLDADPFATLGRAASLATSDSSSESGVKVQAKPNRSSFLGIPSLFKRGSTSKIKTEDSPANGDILKDKAASIEKEGPQSEAPPISATPSSERSKPLMIRERVDIRGQVREMEPMDQISALQVPPEHVCLIKQAPAMRWANGQKEWDRQYQGAAERAIKKRKKIETKYQTLLDHAREQGLLVESDTATDKSKHKRGPTSLSADQEDGTIQEDRRWGPLDLADENPPPSAIAKRRDTPEALALLKKSVYHTAPRTHYTVPKLKAADAVKAAFDPHDDPRRPPRQSVSEQQVYANIIPIHGLKIWDLLVGYFMKESSKKAKKNTKAAVTSIGNNIGINHSSSTTSPGPNA